MGFFFISLCVLAFKIEFKILTTKGKECIIFGKQKNAKFNHNQNSCKLKLKGAMYALLTTLTYLSLLVLKNKSLNNVLM